MTIAHAAVLGAAALALSTLPGHAGPCLQEIARMQAQIDAKLAARATAGPTARESSGALLHHQPTPGSIAAAESKLGEISAETMEALAAAMARAREADRAGDASACEQALADVRRSIGP
jgi:hypothetical protein